MKKNKALLKQAASFFTAFVMLAGSASYAQEVQTQQEENTSTFDVQVQQEEGTALSEVEETNNSVEQETTQAMSVVSEEESEVQTQIPSQELETEEQQSDDVVSETVTQEETEESSLQEESQEYLEETTSEEESDSDGDEEMTEWPTDEFEEGASSSEDAEIYEIGDEFVKTFSLDMTVDTNPIYLGMAGTSTATGSYYDQLDTISKRIYTQIYEANKSGASTAKIKLNLTKIFENQTVTKGSNGKVVYSESTKQSIFSWLGSYVTPAYLALTYDHPELVWLSGAKYTIGYSVYTPIFYDGETSIVTDLELAGSTFSLTPTSDTGALNASKVDSLFNGTKSEIDATLPANATRYDIVKAIHDKICSMVQYEDSKSNIGNAYYQTPYSLYYDADGDGKIETVCAGYAKMMKLQCDKYGIPCVLVTGVTNTGEYHMWNYIQMENSTWYAVDATWDDQSTIMYDFFLVGSETYSSAAFGTKKFGDTHIQSGKWTTSADCVFQYPTLSQNAYQSQNLVVKSGLVKDSDGVWRYYTQNQIDTSCTGLIAYNGSWHYMKSGTQDLTYVGLSQYEGIWYYVEDGVINWDYTGLCQYNNIWFYIKNGQIDWDYTGSYIENGTSYSVEKGVLNWKNNGSALYSSANYAKNSMNTLLNEQSEESSVDATNQYQSDIESSSAEGEESLEARGEQSEPQTEEASQESVETQTTEASVSEPLTEEHVQPTGATEQEVPQKSFLEVIEQYLIQLIENLIKAIATCIG